MIKPREPGGKFGKNLTLKLTGTSRVTTLTTRSGDKVVVAQNVTEIRDLQPKQEIAVVYTSVKKDLILLTAVAQPAPGK